MIGLLCKGSTTDFDSVCLGSNPGNPTKRKKPQQIAEAFFMGGNGSRGLGWLRGLRGLRGLWGLRGLVQKVQYVQWVQKVGNFEKLELHFLISYF